EQSFRRFMKGFEAKTESSIMHRHQSFRAKLRKCFDRFLRIHVHLAPGRRLVCADWQERNIDVVVLSDFSEAGKISAVATMKDRTAFCLDQESAETAMEISQESRAPVITRRQRNFDRPEFHGLPVIKFVHDVETKIVHQIPHTDRHYDRLIRRHAPQSASV